MRGEKKTKKRNTVAAARPRPKKTAAVKKTAVKSPVTKLSSGDKSGFFSSLLEPSAQAIVMTDAGAGILYVNKAFTNMTGYSQKDMTGKNLQMLNHDNDPANHGKSIADALRHHGSWQGELAMTNKNGEVNPLWCCLSAVKDRTGKAKYYAGITLDISSLKQHEEKLQHMAHYDMLTNLPNRSLMYDRLKQTLILAKRYQTATAVMLLDIDRFKEVNDNLGHHVGDQLLIEVSRRLVRCVRESDTIARMGGDEFLAILPEVGNATNAAHVSQKILSTLAEPLELEGHDIFVSASIGIAMYPEDSQDINTLIRNADTAMYHAKAQGKNNFKFFTEGINKSTVERFKLESRLRRALEKLEFQLNYQPKVDIATGSITGMEALLRWYHPEQGSITPGLFIPLAEETGLVVQLGEWALREACRQNKVWQDEGLPPLRVAVNISARHFHRKDLVDMVVAVLEETGLDPRYLMLEITESTIVHDVEDTIKTLDRLRKMGIGISIDDFGTGFSSLNYLNRFSLDELKVDQSFIRNVTDPDSQKVITAIIALAHNLNLKVVAEGVETEEQLRFLIANDCDQTQGYFFSRPLNSIQFSEMIKSAPKWSFD